MRAADAIAGLCLIAAGCWQVLSYPATWEPDTPRPQSEVVWRLATLRMQRAQADDTPGLSTAQRERLDAYFAIWPSTHASSLRPFSSPYPSHRWLAGRRCRRLLSPSHAPRLCSDLALAMRGRWPRQAIREV